MILIKILRYINATVHKPLFQIFVILGTYVKKLKLNYSGNKN